MSFQSNPLCSGTGLFESSYAAQSTPHAVFKPLLALFLGVMMSLLLNGNSLAAEHVIQLTAEETRDDGFGNKLLAYKMLSHTIGGTNVTHRYSTEATIPGPTIELTEGDTVKISILNAIPGNNVPVPGISKQVSIHVHGVHYDILSDGTLKVINKLFDEGAGAGLEETYVVYEYKWNVAPGTAGTWAYHDHNFETHNGAEHKGLFGAIIVNPIGAPQYAKEYVLYLGDDAFWGMEINGANKKQSKHGPNPTLSAREDTRVRFHLIALGTDIHTFKLDGYHWFDPGTHNLINQAAIGPLEKHVFSVKAEHSSQYEDKNLSNRLLGMRGKFNVQ
ncbi:copper oxidase [Nitrosomonas sp. JL21]|uniref:multicopper oxidase domain-containing protein n=1 Tax=Nitrosomonas sp. JL21 TaxID=153949 RepID=UPI001370B5AA|nr:multicopper oxidase domain-containing protein [Nitrosomonas sp. JL21]MBL8496265.1 multicopper oxidase domain-containing protein [Nitrosomonas sp.]MXS76968.1 copper oxidase [Nitrosomonas sp. JL21]